MATIQGVFLALFGRPADTGGLEFFNAATSNGANLTAIGDLASTAEYQDRFAGMSNDQIINSIYQSLFGRDGEAAGVEFWLAKLASGELNINNIAIAILDGAQDNDLANVNAKLIAANLFTSHLDLPAEQEAYAGSAAAGVGRDFISAVSAIDGATSSEADAAIDLLFNNGQQPGGGQAPGGGNGGGVVDIAPVWVQRPGGQDTGLNENTTVAFDTYVATDANGDVITYSIVGGTGAELFSIDETTGQLKPVAAFDYEGLETTNFTLTLAATANNVSVNQTINVTVSNTIDTVAELQNAIDQATEGSTIVLGSGVIEGRFTIDSSITIQGSAGTIIKGGFDLVDGAKDVALKGLSIEVVGAGEGNSGVLVASQSALKNLSLTNVDVYGDDAGRGLVLNEVFGPAGVNVSVVGGSFDGLLTGIYAGVNKGHQFTIAGSEFTGNTAGIGGVGNGVGLNVSNTDFSGNISDDIGVEGGAKLAKLILSGNSNLDLLNVYDKFGPFVFSTNGPVNESNVVLVGDGASISKAIAGAGNFTVLLGAGDHQETLVLSSKVILAGVAGATLVGDGGISTIELQDGSDGTIIRDLHIYTDGQNAVYNFPGQDVRNITLDGNTFDAGMKSSGTAVYANPGSDGWVISGNTFVGEMLKFSGFIGLEGSGHHVTGNAFGELASNYPKIESFTPSVIFDSNTGTGDVSFYQYDSSAGHNGGYVQNVINVSDIANAIEVRSGSVVIVDGPFDARGNSLQFISGDETDGRLRFNEVFSQAEHVKLGDIDVLQFDFLTDIASRGTATPVLRIAIDADGDLATTNDRGELVFEWAYQNDGNSPRDAWTTVDVTGDDLVLWQRSRGANHDQIDQMTKLSDWQDGFAPSDGTGLAFGANSVVLGFSIAFGSYNGTGVMFTDNVAIGTTGVGGEVDVYNFV